MMNRFNLIKPDLHGVLDYAAAAGLIALPFLLDLQSQSILAHWLSIIGGLGLILYSLFTDYLLGLKGVFSFRAHLRLDLAAAALFFLAPFIFGFQGIVTGYYLVMGAGVIIVVALSQRGDIANPLPADQKRSKPVSDTR